MGISFRGHGMSNFLVRISTVVLLLVTLFTLSYFLFLVLGESFFSKKMLLVRSFHFLFSPLGWKGGAALFAFLSDFDLHLSLSCYISSSESSNWVERKVVRAAGSRGVFLGRGSTAQSGWSSRGTRSGLTASRGLAAGGSTG